MMSERLPRKSNSSFEKERAFHDERWSKKTEGFNLRRKTSDDFMRDEANRDNADFDKRQHVEFEKWQESLRVVIENLKSRIENPNDPDNTVMLIMMGGGMKGPYTAGQGLALQMVGLTPEKVDMVVGTSTGAVVATAFVAGIEAMKKSTTMMLEELSSKDFINPARFWEVIKIRMIKKLWTEEGEYALNIDGIKKAKPDLIYTATEPVKGDEEPIVRLLDAKTIEPGMVDGVMASMSIPYITGEIPEIDGETYYDGGFGRMDIEAYIDEFTKRHGKPPKNILILPTMPFDVLENIKPSVAEMKLAEFAQKRAGSLVQAGSLDKAASLRQIEKGLLLKAEQRKALELIQQRKGIHIGIMWPPNSDLTTMSIDGGEMKEAVLSSARDTIKQFGEKQPDEIPLYVSLKQKLKDAISKFKTAA